jgi:aspartate/methionine/tyrosine aminotransferase
MFSRRTPASFAPNPLTRAVAERRATGLRLDDLTISNPTQCGIPYPEAALLAALSDPRSLTYEPSAKGLTGAREAIAAWHCGLDPERLILAGSTSEAYGWLFRLLCNPGQAVLAPRPSYPLFDCLAELDSVRLEHYSLVEADGWRIGFDQLERAATADVRAIILVNPNNPTGSYVHPRDWDTLLELAARRNLAIIADEVFFDYHWRPTARRSGFQDQSEALVFTLSGLSKSIGLPQMKLGWVHVSGPARLRAEAIERLEWIADAYLPVSAPVQHAAAGWLDVGRGIQESVKRRCLAGLESVRSGLSAGGGMRMMEPQGGWSVVIEVPRVRTDEEWAIGMVRRGFLFQPGYFYDFEGDGRLVLSLLARPDRLRDGVNALVSIADGEAG